MAVQPYGETLETLADGEVIYLGDRPATVERVRPGSGRARLLKVRSVDDRDRAEQLRGLEVRVARDRLPALDEGEYYEHDLIGLAVTTEDGRPLGSLEGILEIGPHDVYRVVGPDGERLLPATREVVREIDLEARRMTVRILEDA